MTPSSSAPEVTRADFPAIIGKFNRLDSTDFISQLSHHRAGLQEKTGEFRKILEAFSQEQAAQASNTSNLWRDFRCIEFTFCPVQYSANLLRFNYMNLRD